MKMYFSVCAWRREWLPLGVQRGRQIVGEGGNEQRVVDEEVSRQGECRRWRKMEEIDDS